MDEYIIDYLPCGDISELDLDLMILEDLKAQENVR